MKAEFINNGIASRKKLVLNALICLFALFVFCFIRYYFAPTIYQTGEKSSKFWFSLNMFVFSIILAILILLPMAIYSKIICRLLIDKEMDILEIEYVNKFRIKPITKTVKLSKTLIHVAENQYRERDFKLGEIYYSINISNPDFGHIHITAQDFKNINEISLQFKQLIDSNVKEVRTKRLIKTRAKRLIRNINKKPNW